MSCIVVQCSTEHLFDRLIAACLPSVAESQVNVYRLRALWIKHFFSPDFV